ncbi:MAG: M48 family metallopeptidase [Clostridia bacterium]|nr:M48 family metallopeptidase [Clostridia bacterium]
MKRRIICRGRPLAYTLIHSTAVTQVRLEALPGEGILARAPAYLPLREIDERVRDEAEALLKALERAEGRGRPPAPADGGELWVEGIPRRLRLHRGPGPAGRLEPEAFHLTLERPDCPMAVEAALCAALSALTLCRVRAAVEAYAPGVGRRPGRITVRAQKMRWGSCSRRGDMRFNWKLILAPPRALEYVVVHELCHLYEFNHSPRFWKRVAAQMPDYTIWKKWLKVHGRDLW